MHSVIWIHGGHASFSMNASLLASIFFDDIHAQAPHDREEFRAIITPDAAFIFAKAHKRFLTDGQVLGASFRLKGVGIVNTMELFYPRIPPRSSRIEGDFEVFRVTLEKGKALVLQGLCDDL